MAFTVLRRAVTGDTGSIDDVYRDLMKNKSSGGADLGSYFDENRAVPDVKDIKKFLISRLDPLN